VIYLFIDFNIDQFRNALAASFGLLAIIHLSNNKSLLSFFWFVISVAIHNSMIWLVILYFVKYNSHLRFLIVLFLSVIILIPDKALLINSFLNELQLDNIAIGIHFINKLTSYTYNSIQDSNTVIFALVIIKSIFIYSLAWKYKVNKIFLDVYLFAILLYYVFIEFNTLGGRILRDALLLEPVLLFFILKNNIKWILLVPFILLFNILAKNLGHFERIFC